MISIIEMIRKLRKRPRISYYELEEPDPDQYVFCTNCRDMVYEYCSIHGSLLVVPDADPDKYKYPSYVPMAALTVPNKYLHIAPSNIPGAGLGIFSSMALPEGVRFGPFVGVKVTDTDSNSAYSWQIYDSKQKPCHVIDASNANKSNWMRYVNCSRHWIEQNLVAYQYQGKLYYRTCKLIPRHTELLVYYGNDFGRVLHIDFRRYNKVPLPPLEYINGSLLLKQKTNNGSSAPKKGIAAPQQIREVNETKKSNGISNVSTKTSSLSNNCGQECSQQKKTFICDVCQKQFSRGDRLRRHLLIHSGKKAYKCNVCQKRFSDSYSLRKHMRVHTGEKPYKCDICQKKFSKSYSLREHRRIHTGETPYTCDVCQRQFKFSSGFRRHWRIHRREKL